MRCLAVSLITLVGITASAQSSQDSALTLFDSSVMSLRSNCGIKTIRRDNETCFAYSDSGGMVCKPNVCQCKVSSGHGGCTVLCNTYPGCHFP